MNRPPKRTSTFGTSEWLAGAVKSRPEALLLLAAGCALLMRSGSDSSSRPSAKNAGRGQAGEHGGRRETQDDGRARTLNRRGDRNIDDELSDAAQGAREYASGLVDQVSETASSYVSSASTYAHDARRMVSEQSQRFAQQAQSTLQETMNRVLQDQPLAIALAGLAAGAALAAAFPATETEKRTLGPTGGHLMDAAAQTGEQLKEATAKAGERLMSAAEERGLSAEGVKEMARDAAGAFGTAFSGEQAQQDRQAKPDSSPDFRSQSSATQLDPKRPAASGRGSTEKRGPR